MRKHLVCYSAKASDYNSPFLNLSGWLYWQKRLQFWKWRKQHTLGRPVLVLRKKELEEL